MTLTWNDALAEAMGAELSSGAGCLLQAATGEDRCQAERLVAVAPRLRRRIAPVSGASLLAIGAGLARAGLRTIVEATSETSVADLLAELAEEVATCQYYSAGRVKLPLLVRAMVGRDVGVGEDFAPLAGLTGVHVVLPATLRDAVGVLRTALRCVDPVVFLEHRALRGATVESLPPGELALGTAVALRRGASATVVALGAAVAVAEQACERLAKEGHEVDLLDPVTLAPLDMASIGRSLAKTGRLLVVDSARGAAGPGAEIVARVAESLFDELDAPPRRVSADPTPNAPSCPSVSRVLTTLRDLIVAKTDDPA